MPDCRELSDAAWERTAPVIVCRPYQNRSTGRGNGVFVEGVQWIMRMGVPWRALPEILGEWKSVSRGFNR